MLNQYQNLAAAATKAVAALPAASEAFEALATPELILHLLGDLAKTRKRCAELEDRCGYSVKISSSTDTEPQHLYGSVLACADVIAMGHALHKLKRYTSELLSLRQGELPPIHPLVLQAFSEYKKARDARSSVTAVSEPPIPTEALAELGDSLYLALAKSYSL